MILAGVLLKLGSYGLIIFLPLFTHGVLYFYLSVSLVGGVVCCFTCVRHWDTKGLIAYSSVVHIGVVSIGVLSGSDLGYYCATSIIVAHGLCSPLLFGLVFLLYTKRHTRLLVHNRGGLSNPGMCLIAFGLLSVNMGLPPFLNVWSEVILFCAVSRIAVVLLPFLLFTAFLAVLYNLVLYVFIVHGKEQSSMVGTFSPWHFVSSLSISVLFRFNTSILCT